MTVKKQVSYSDNIIIREACGVNRMCVNVIADFVLIAVSGCGYKSILESRIAASNSGEVCPEPKLKLQIWAPLASA